MKPAAKHVATPRADEISLTSLEEKLSGAELRAALFGIEREGVRVTPDGSLALTPHPPEFGDKLENPEITVDFSESQLELVTAPEPTPDRALAALGAIQSTVETILAKRGERLWPFSMPPVLPSDTAIPIARFASTPQGRQRELYRRGLASRYGASRQLISGIHVNFSFGPELLARLRGCSALGDDHERAWRDAVYFRTARNFLRDRWLLVALTGASPAADPSYDPLKMRGENAAAVRRYLPDRGDTIEGDLSHATSLRVSPVGYADSGAGAMPVSFDGLERYVRDIRRLMATRSSRFSTLGDGAGPHPAQLNDRILQLEKEFYAPVRLKGAPPPGETHLDAMARDGVRYAEIRLVDVNPLVREGIDLQTLRLLHVFMLSCLLGPDRSIDSAEWQRLEDNHLRVALHGRRSGLRLHDPRGRWTPLPDLARPLLRRLARLARLMDRGLCDIPYAQAIAVAADALADPSRLLSARIVARMREVGQSHGKFGVGLLLPQGLSSSSSSSSPLPPGISSMNTERFASLELSTQLLAREAMRRSVRVDVLDVEDNFLRLSRGGSVQYVKQATRTAADTYIAALIMENKDVTKQVLREHGLPVPAGVAVHNLDEAAAAWPALANRSLVIKPRSTNFGEGVAILKEPRWEPEGRAAVQHALTLDSTVLLEEFVPGREFRFLVIGDETVAVLHRIPANVLGDGRSSIRQLVEEKNRDPRRGSGYVTPLEKIQLGAVEESHLRASGRDFSSVPKDGETVYLRENSNISTGGDSLDFTDDVHPGYKEAAVRAARAVGAQICGADIIIADIHAAPTEGGFSIIELNFNPALHIHAHPYRGADRKVEGRVLDLIGFPDKAGAFHAPASDSQVRPCCACCAA